MEAKHECTNKYHTNPYTRDCHMEHKHLYYSGKSENRTVELHTAREHVRWPLHVEVHAVDMG